MDGNSGIQLNPDLPVLQPISPAPVVTVPGHEPLQRKDSFDSGVDEAAAEAAKKSRRSSDASAKTKKIRKKGKRTAKRSMAAKKNGQEDDDATEIEDNADDEEDFEWPVRRVPRSRPLPPVPQTHVDLIDRFCARGIITDEAVKAIMMKLDFGIFYHNVKDEWVEHTAVIIERTIKYLKPGFRVLLSPLHLYYAVALALLVGEDGGVVSFGHYGNVHTLTKAGLDWMLDDYRLRFTNNRYELFYGKPSYEDFLTGGFPKGAPYDLIIMTDQRLSDAVMSQLKEPGGIVIRPDIEDFILHPPHLIPHPPDDTEAEADLMKS